MQYHKAWKHSLCLERTTLVQEAEEASKHKEENGKRHYSACFFEGKKGPKVSSHTEQKKCVCLNSHSKCTINIGNTGEWTTQRNKR
jgi:hypothetical protein